MKKFDIKTAALIVMSAALIGTSVFAASEAAQIKEYQINSTGIIEYQNEIDNTKAKFDSSDLQNIKDNQDAMQTQIDELIPMVESKYNEGYEKGKEEALSTSNGKVVVNEVPYDFYLSGYGSASAGNYSNTISANITLYNSEGTALISANSYGGYNGNSNDTQTYDFGTYKVILTTNGYSQAYWASSTSGCTAWMCGTTIAAYIEVNGVRHTIYSDSAGGSVPYGAGGTSCQLKNLAKTHYTGKYLVYDGHYYAPQ